ncbi:MAG: Ribosomal RNA small subunit methyltransferase A [Parcubacteria group bacterium GW2011_GWA2_42_14]|nr:MAG: Ribosomal RNA small subunit methyltransferase A [Parcubacteria group bacterium GW2011_GWA2_42_14]
MSARQTWFTIEIINNTPAILKKRRFSPNKLLGQNFLISRKFRQKIIEAANLSPEDSVLEVGAGDGTLTFEIAKFASSVIAIEKDAKLASLLQEIAIERKIKNIIIINGDILKFAPKKFAEKLKNYKLIGNIPYYLTSRLLRKFLEEEKLKPKEIILTVQKEVAERITAIPPHMNILALSVQIYGKPEIMEKIPADAFWPKPKVDSAIIKISEISDDFFAKNKIEQKNFFSLIKTAFSKKRKTLANSLSKYFGDKKTAEEKIKKAGLHKTARPEELNLENWVKLLLQ